MWLRRVTPEPFGSTFPKFDGMGSDDLRVENRQLDMEIEPTVIANFERFGGGQHRQSDFEVCASWHDVEKLIDKFCEAKQPKAIAMRQAMKLAEAAKVLGWTAPQSN